MDRLLLVCWQGTTQSALVGLIRNGSLPRLAEVVRTGAAGPLSSFSTQEISMLLAMTATGVEPDGIGQDTPAIWRLLSERGIPAGAVGWDALPAEPAVIVLPPAEELSVEDWRVEAGEVDPAVLALLAPRLEEMPADDACHGLLRDHLAALYTTHGRAVALARTAGRRFLAVHYGFLAGIARDFGIYAVPEAPGVSAAEREMLGPVLANAHRLQDLLLADLLRQQPAELLFLALAANQLHGFQAATAARAPLRGIGEVAAAVGRFFGVELPVSTAPAAVSAFAPAQVGAALLDLGRPERALVSLEAAHFAVPEDARTADALVRCYLQLGLLEEAESLISLLPGSASRAGRADLLRALLELARGCPLAALDLAGQARRPPAAAGEWNRLSAAALLMQGRAREALPFIEDALRREPADALAHYGLALARAGLGETPAAHAALDDALRLRPGWGDAEALRARLQHDPRRRSEPQDARPLWQALALRAERRETLRAQSRARRETAIGRLAPQLGPWQVRLARLTEHARVAAFFRLPAADPWRRWIIAAGELQQITGVLQMNRVGSSGQLDFAIDEAWAGRPAAAALLTAALEEARGLGLSTLACAADAEGKFATHLAAQGFVETRREEVWSVPFASWLETNQPLLVRLAGSLPVVPLTSETVAVAADLTMRHGLYPPNLATSDLAGRYDSRLSFLAAAASAPAGVILARVLTGTLYVEALVENPDCPRRQALPALLLATFTAAQAMGVRTALCTFSPIRSPSLPALLRRGRGMRTQSTGIYRWEKG